MGVLPLADSTAAPARDGAASAKSSSTSREIWLAVIGGALLMLILAVVGRQTNTPQSSSPAPSNAATEFDRMTPAQHLTEAKRLINDSSSPDQFTVAGKHLEAVLAVDRNNKEASRLQDRAIKLMKAAISRDDFVTKLNETNSNKGIHGHAAIDWQTNGTRLIMVDFDALRSEDAQGQYIRATKGTHCRIGFREIELRGVWWGGSTAYDLGCTSKRSTDSPT